MDDHTDIDADSIGAVTTLVAQDGIGSGDALETQLYAVDALNQDAGAIQITEEAAGGDLLIYQARQVNSTGDIEIETLDGDLTVSLEQFGVESQSGDITLFANGVGNSLYVSEEVASAGGDIMLRANQGRGVQRGRRCFQ